MDRKIVANTIEKHLSGKLVSTPFSEIYEPHIKVEDYGFKPVGMNTFSIFEDSIIASPAVKGVYEFKGSGEVVYSEGSSNVQQKKTVNFHGTIHIKVENNQPIIDEVRLDRIPPLKPIIPDTK
ncbi:MAG: hypothetical protein K2K92_03135 [Duncaniella sp.]|nr:hypothetical protein [Duncaniella sp.]